MPRQTLSVTDEDLKWHADRLPPTTKITEKQAATLLGCSSETLRWRRRRQSEKLLEAEKSEALSVPDFDLLPVDQIAHRHSVRYLLGDVMRAVHRHRHVSTQARDATRQHRQEGWMGFGGWLSQASLTDTWTFVVVGGLPIDFVTSLAMAEEADWENDEEDVRDLSLADYLRMRLTAANRVQSEEEAAALFAGTGYPVSKNRECARCGRASHPGPCRL